MDYFQKFIRQFRNRLFALFFINNLIILGDWWLADKIFRLGGWWLIAALVIIPLLSLTILPWVTTRLLTQPTKLIWQAILHLAPDATNIAAPDIKSTHFGRELVTHLNNQVYQLATTAAKIDMHVQAENQDLHHNVIATNLPLPLLVLDPKGNVLFANEASTQYLGLNEADMKGHHVYDVLDMSFQDNATLDAWLTNVRANAVSATQTWERVKLDVPKVKTGLRCDIAAYYNKNNPLGYETQLILFDHTESYGRDDQAMGYVALAVHELRTPLTLLRGYIEALGENLDSSLSNENAQLLQKMDASAQQLAAFVNNVLNVARVEENQFQIQLHEERWDELLTAAINDMNLRAGIQGITISSDIAKGLPTVGIDRVSIYEVITNLLDNAIKYSAKSTKILVKSTLNNEGLVETSVTDYGVGVAESIISHLFDRYYRSHRSKAQVGGTGLGLFLCKTIVSAHGGNIWVRSKEGQGSVFTFTVVPYAKLSAQQKGTKDFTRLAHGWIKNHSLYRR